MRFLILLQMMFVLTALKGQEIDSLTVYYVPWGLNIEGEFTENLVRNYPDYSKKVSLKDKEVIGDFLLSVSILNLRSKVNFSKKFIPKMVIDIHGKTSCGLQPELFTKTIFLDSRQNLKFNDQVYYKNFSLERWLKKNLQSK